MSTTKQLVIGLGISCTVAVAGAAGARHLADRVELPSKQSFSVVRPLSALKIVKADEDVRAFATNGSLRLVQVGDELPRPTGFVTSELEGFVHLEMPDVKIQASREAQFTINAPGKRLKVYLNRGRLLVHRMGGVSVNVPDENLTVEGTTFSVWVQDDRTLIAVLDGQVEVNANGTKNTYAKDREVVITPEGSTFAVIPDKLTVFIDEAEDLGGRFLVRGKTNPYAQLMVRRGEFYEEVEIEPSGQFSTELERNEPATNELIAFDTVGRRAEVAQPSGDLGSIVDAVVVRKDAVDTTGQKAPAIQVDVAQKEVDTAQQKPEQTPSPEGSEEESSTATAAPEDSAVEPEKEGAETNEGAAEKPEDVVKEEPKEAEAAAPEAVEAPPAPSPKPAKKVEPAIEKPKPPAVKPEKPASDPAETKEPKKAAAKKEAPEKTKKAPASKPQPEKSKPKKKAKPKAKKKTKVKTPPKALDLSDDDLELEWD
ncbi:MAG: hypothetical protein VYC39_03520 [Myxococcota bacterium]|nr:hypothetical protein [Myxococcota bacterium]